MGKVLYYPKKTTGGGVAGVSSFEGRTGAVVSQSGDYVTGQVLETANKKYVTDAEKTNIATIPSKVVKHGVESGGVLINGSTSSNFSISDGVGYINGVQITWTGKTDIAVTNIATSTVTFVGIDVNSNVIQTTTDFTEQQNRDYIYLGQLGHSNLASIATIVPQPHVANEFVSQSRDWLTYVNINLGNAVVPNGANLSINKQIGRVISLGIGYDVTPTTPNQKTFPLQTLATIRRRTQTGGTGTSTTLDVLNYDLNGVVTAISGTKSQNQRVFLLPSGNLVVQYGQQLYNSIAEAQQGLNSENFILLENVKSGFLIAIITVQSNCTSLQDTTRAKISYPSKFGELSAATSGAALTTLQQAYGNSAEPEILTNAVNGAVTIRRGSAVDTDTVIEGKNGAGTTTFSVNGNGEGNFTELKKGGVKVLTTLTKTLNLEAPTVLDKIVFGRFENLSTATSIRAVLEGASTPSVTFVIKYATDKNAAGTNLVNSVAVTNVTNGVSLTLVNNTGIPAGSWVWVEISAVSGAVSNLILDMNYKED